MSANIKRHATALCRRTPIDEIYAVSEFATQLMGWKVARRFSSYATVCAKAKIA